MDDILKKIRIDLRRYMNGVVSANMRKRGIHYKVNFGIDIPRLREMAKQYSPDKEMALYMFSRNVREMKIMATLLYPKEQMTEEEAMEWIESIEHQEIREQMCINLLQYVSFSHTLVERCIDTEKLSSHITGYWLYSRLAMSRDKGLDKINSTKLILSAIEDSKEELQLARQASFNALKFAGRVSKEKRTLILASVKNSLHLSRENRDTLYSALEEEFNLME